MRRLAEALLIIDLQKGVCFGEETIYNLEELIKIVNQRILAYSRASKPIIIVQHTDDFLLEGSESWEIIEELDHDKADYFIQKTHANSFYYTQLKNILDKHELYDLEICGAQTEFCIDTTVKVAHSLGYTLQMIQGATTTYNHAFMTAEQTIKFYESIWNQRFLSLIN